MPLHVFATKTRIQEKIGSAVFYIRQIMYLLYPVSRKNKDYQNE